MTMIREFIKRHMNDYTDSSGEVDTIGLIELVEKEFGCNPENAEKYVTEYLEEIEL